MRLRLILTNLSVYEVPDGVRDNESNPWKRCGIKNLQKQKASFLRMPYVNLTKIYEKMRYSYTTNLTRILVNAMKQSLKIVKTIKLIVKTLIT